MNEIAKISGRDLRISRKQSVEICSFIRNKDLNKAKTMLEDVLDKKIAVPFKRYNRDVGHKPGIAAGRYPMNASVEILRLLKGVEANAENKGLNKNELYISKITANKGSGQWHFGRKRRRRMKRTNIYIEVAEKSTKKSEKKESKIKTEKK